MPIIVNDVLFILYFIFELSTFYGKSKIYIMGKDIVSTTFPR